MTIGISSTLRDARLDLIKDAIDLGGDEYGGGILRIYSGTRPATGGALGGAVLLLEYDLAWPCGTITSGVLTLDSVASTIGLAAGTATWARIVDVDENFVMDLSVTEEGAGGDIVLSSTLIAISMEVLFISGGITEGNA